MTKKISSIILGFAAISIIAFCGCKKKKKSSDFDDSVTYYQEYTATFNRSDNSTEATAFIRLNDKKGSRISFVDGAYLHANGANENDKQGGSENYHWRFSDVKQVNFEIKKNGGTMINNTIEPNDVGSISFGSMPGSFSKNVGFSFNWIGDDLNGDELIITLIGHNNSGAEVTKTLNADKDKTTFVFVAQVSDLKAGDVTIKMERSRNFALDASEGNAGGNMKATTVVSKVLYMSN